MCDVWAGAENTTSQASCPNGGGTKSSWPHMSQTQ